MAHLLHWRTGACVASSWGVHGNESRMTSITAQEAGRKGPISSFRARDGGFL
jgi:hypothetical protein